MIGLRKVKNIDIQTIHRQKAQKFKLLHIIASLIIQSEFSLLYRNLFFSAHLTYNAFDFILKSGEENGWTLSKIKNKTPQREGEPICRINGHRP